MPSWRHTKSFDSNHLHSPQKVSAITTASFLPNPKKSNHPTFHKNRNINMVKCVCVEQQPRSSLEKNIQREPRRAQKMRKKRNATAEQNSCVRSAF
ncbi:MAG: hypothetical protein CL932_05570 [Deltaproteobacteria bacterium]|nr:hypothetical protein [Deltaproteobacteria bacterium]